MCKVLGLSGGSVSPGGGKMNRFHIPQVGRLLTVYRTLSIACPLNVAVSLSLSLNLSPSFPFSLSLNLVTFSLFNYFFTNPRSLLIVDSRRGWEATGS